MPTRQFSAAILGGAWPFTDPAQWDASAESYWAKGSACLAAAEELRAIARRVAQTMRGPGVEGFCSMLHRRAAVLTADADDHWMPMCRAAREIARLINGQQLDLDELDRGAHETIATIEAAPVSRAAMWTAIWAEIGEARVRAFAIDTAAAGSIAKQTFGQGAPQHRNGNTAGTESVGDPVDPTLRALAEAGAGGGGSSMPNVPRDARAGDSGPPAPGDNKHSDISGDKSSTTNSNASSTTQSDDHPAAGDKKHSSIDGVGDGEHDAADAAGGTQVAGQNIDNKTVGAPSPGDVSRESISNATGLTGSPASASGLKPAEGLGGSTGAMMPTGRSASSLPGASAPVRPAAFGSGGVPTQAATGMTAGGVPSGSTGGAAGRLPGGGAGAVPPPLGAPPASSADFSRGLNAGLGAGSGPAAFAPPVAQPPGPAASGTSSMPVGAAPPGGPAVTPSVSPAAAAGSPASPMPAPAVGFPGVPGGGPVGPAPGPTGPLPPFGSDVSRGPVVTPASASAQLSGSSPGPGSAGGGTAPPPALPSGVVGPGVGASAAAATEAVRSERPDPLLEEASALVYELMHASRRYGMFSDWAVAVVHTRSGPRTLIASSEGAGYIPRGVFLPRSVHMVFTDPALSPQWRARWFSRSNPAEVALAYAAIAAEQFGAETWALAVSTTYGGSAAPARSAGVPHIEECSYSTSPIPAHRPATMPLDERHQHRLETLDPGLYARLTGYGGRLPDRSESWRITTTAADTVLARVAALPDIAVPPIVCRVLDTLSRGVPVPAGEWSTLNDATVDVLGQGSGLRPGRIPGDDQPASPTVRGYHDLGRLRLSVTADRRPPVGLGHQMAGWMKSATVQPHLGARCRRGRHVRATAQLLHLRSHAGAVPFGQHVPIVNRGKQDRPHSDGDRTQRPTRLFARERAIQRAWFQLQLRHEPHLSTRKSCSESCGPWYGSLCATRRANCRFPCRGTRGTYAAKHVTVATSVTRRGDSGIRKTLDRRCFYGPSTRRRLRVELQGPQRMWR
jgi:hypothetical protein